MSASRNVLTVLIVGLTGLALWYGLVQRKTPAARAATAPTAVRAAPTSPRATTSHAGIAETKVVTPAVSSAIDYAKTFQEATNYQSFILSALPAARRGDRDAEYYLSAAIAYCDETYRFFFRRREKTLSVDEAIAERSKTGDYQLIEGIRRAYGRCHEVNDSHDPAWGTADQWLAKAADAGQPVAQMRTAENILLRITSTGAAGVPKPGSPGETRTASDARSLVRAAVESRDPEVIFEMPELLGLLKPQMPQTEFAHESLIWEYVACQRGLDCGVRAEWHLQFCLWDPNCLPDESGIDYLRRSAQLRNMVDFEEQANALNAKLDAQAWDELGLGG